LARAQNSKGIVRLSGPDKLLLMIHTKICRKGRTTNTAAKKRYEVYMARGLQISIRIAQGPIRSR
jgi:hypothetical protein